MSLKKEIQDAINKASAENGSNTPDFILAEYLWACLRAFDEAVLVRDRWYGLEHSRKPPETHRRALNDEPPGSP